MRLNANVLHAGIVSNNTGRRSITTPYTSTGWNHIALVYNSSELALYVNGVQVAANNALPHPPKTSQKVPINSARNFFIPYFFNGEINALCS